MKEIPVHRLAAGVGHGTEPGQALNRVGQNDCLANEVDAVCSRIIVLYLQADKVLSRLAENMYRVLSDRCMPVAKIPLPLCDVAGLKVSKMDF